MAPPAVDNKWDPLIEQINSTESLSEKVNLLATMVRMVAVNDMSCLDGRIAALGQKFDTCMKKVYAIGLAIAVLEFTGIDITTVINLILRIIQ